MRTHDPVLRGAGLLTPASGGRPLIADGGLGTRLEAMGVDVRGPSWSAAALHDDPAAIRAAHLAFFEAGADLAVTASYQVCFDGPASAGAEASDVEVALRASTRLAREAAEIAHAADGVRRLVAASVGPYGASLADGSEYTGDYGLDLAALRRWHRRRLGVLAESGADLLALETIPSMVEVEALLAEVEGLGVPVWLSVTADGSRTRTGEPLADVFALAASSAAAIAVGVNCCGSDGVEHALDAAAAVAPGLGVVVYPNGPGVWDAAARVWRLDERTGDPLSAAVEWAAAGATVIGGCCRVTPEHIRTLRTRFA